MVGDEGCENRKLTTAHHDLCDSFCHRFIYSTLSVLIPKHISRESEETDLTSDYCQPPKQLFSDSKQGQKERKRQDRVATSVVGGGAGGGGEDYSKSSNVSFGN